MTATLCMRAVEFRADGEGGDGRTLEGIAAVFWQPAEICSWDGDFIEEIQAGAFRKTLRARTPILQYDHGRDPRTGTVPIGSITSLTETDEGLAVVARLFDNMTVDPIRQAIAGNAITGMSIRFVVTKDVWTDNAGQPVKAGELDDLLWMPGDRGPLKRTILEIDPLYELGPVAFPAYDTTTVGVRSLLAQATADDRRWLLRELTRSRPVGERPELFIPSTAGDHTGPTDPTGQPAARSGGGGASTTTEPGNGEVSLSPEARARHRRLRLEGILK